jgi:hypothetical protein
VEKSLSSAQRVGAEAAALQCEALLLEGDLLARLRPEDERADAYYRRVFEVARRYEYPEETWDLIESAVARLPHSSQGEKAEYLGPVPELRIAKEADDREGRVLSDRGARGTSDMAYVSSGRVPNADQTVAAMRSGFRRCFQKLLTAGSQRSGRAVLTISIGSSGVVENVEAESKHMDSATVDCLAAEARRAVFDPPQTSHAVLQVPVTLVQQ